MFAKTSRRPQIRTFLALMKTPIKLPTIKEEKTFAKNLIPMMKPHCAIVMPLERASMGKKELMMEEDIPERRREEQSMTVLAQCMITKAERE